MSAATVIGIDLGTTNSALASVSGDGEVVSFAVPQVVAAGQVATRATLPSFLLLPSEQEVAPAALALPWTGAMRYCVGEFARERGAEIPHRLVSSAKSWLCSNSIDRRAQVLPWRGTQRELEAEITGERVSPVNAAARYLAHLRAAWDDAHPDAPIEETPVMLTVPASFDASARELTVIAAREAGYASVTLLEEPQAAFYAYLAARGEAWRKEIGPGDVVLVCDIGGGTTDFSLIEVTNQDGELGLARIAVGDHILLGGDNMDLALAAVAGKKLAAEGKTLDALQQRALVYACRRAKEQMFSSDIVAAPIALAARGSRLIGGTVRTELVRSEVEAMVLEGFFPAVAADARVERRRAAALREIGLPYAHDPAITRHLAEFLARHDRQPTAVLFNGGVSKAPALVARIVQTLQRWAGRDVRVLAGADADVAVAIGAAHYARIRAGFGGKQLRIRGGTARAYYIGIESAMPAIPGFAPPVKGLCVAPAGLEEGSTVALPDDELGLVVGENVSFRFFASSTRAQDGAGALIDLDEPSIAQQVHELDPVEKQVDVAGDLRAGDVVPVRLEATVTEVGTLELWCVARHGQDRWKLEYSVREQPDA